MGDRLALTPPFREHVGSYSVTVGYRVTEISLAASARVPGAVITVTGRRPDGAPLKTGTRIDGVDLDLGGKRLRADTLRSFVDLSVGENEIAVEVANGGAGTKRTYRATVVRLDADLENADERSQLFREALLKGSADGLSRAIAVGESGEVALRNEMVSSCDVLHGLSEGSGKISRSAWSAAVLRGSRGRGLQRFVPTSEDVTDDSNARLTASGSFSITCRRVAAGPLTRRVPCSHFR